MKMPEIHLDFETRSTIDLVKRGLHVYAQHPTTDVWVAVWSVDDGDLGIWQPGDPVPEELMRHVRAGVRVIAHNAGFEWAIWNEIMVKRYGWEHLPFGQMECTAAMAAAMSLPRALGNAAIAMGLSERKDDKGKRVMMQMAKPRRIEADGTIIWWDVPEKLQILIDYCCQDVRTERALHKKLQPLSDYERRVWMLDHTINVRGVTIDLPSVRKAHRMVTDALAELDKALKRVTGGAVAKVNQVTLLLDWLHGQGVHLDSLDKAHVAEALDGPLPQLAREALLIRQEAAKSSTKKLDAMLARVNEDGRSRETVMYHAAGTGRWGGKGIQLQNLPRPKMKAKDVLLAFSALTTGKVGLLELFGSIPSVVADMLRGMVIAKPGHVLIRADYSNIEGRVLAWLAGEEWKLQAFRDFDTIIGHDERGEPIRKGPDLYLVAAAGIYGTHWSVYDKNSPERQIGKVSELACGFGGGVGAFQSMAAIYGIKVPDSQADEIKEAWRALHPAVVDMWKALEKAAMEAVRCPGKPISSAVIGWGDDRREVKLKVSFAVAGNLLWCKLPSGRLLAYPDPKIRDVETPWGEMRPAVTFMGMNDKNQWVRQKSYGGFWAENITQAVARDIMADAMLRIEYDRGWPIVLTVHDEIVSEVPEGTVTVAEYEAEMMKIPIWAAGLPVTTEGDVGTRYGK